MIFLSRLNGKGFYVNPHLIEFIEETPDTVITLNTGKKIVVEEGAEQVVESILAYRARIVAAVPRVIAPEETVD